MKKSTFLFNLLATTALATSAHAGVIQGSGWSFDSTTGMLEITGDIQDDFGQKGYVNGDGLQTTLSSAGVSLSSVSNIKFGEGVTHVSSFNAGYYPSYLHSVSFPSTLEEIADNTFSGNGLTSVTFDPGATGLDIGAYAFGGCYNLSQVELPDNVKLATDSFSGEGRTFVLGKMDEGVLADYSLSSAATIICKDSSCVTPVQNSQGTGDSTPLFAPDENGVYYQVNLSSGSQEYYASVEDLLNNSSCETYDACKALAAANNSNNTSSSGSSGGSSAGNNNGTSQNEPRRIYTLDEARAAVEAAGTDTVKVRIRYK